MIATFTNQPTSKNNFLKAIDNKYDKFFFISDIYYLLEFNLSATGIKGSIKLVVKIMSDSSSSDGGAVTFVGQSYAKVGFKFYFKKPRTDICPKNCRLYNTCMLNPKPNTIYKVEEVLEAEHTCPSNYHLEPMRLVKLSEPPIEIIVESKRAFLGSTINYTPIKCEKKECPIYEFCQPVMGLGVNERLKIIKIIRKVKDNLCKNLNLSLVVVKKIKKQ